MRRAPIFALALSVAGAFALAACPADTTHETKSAVDHGEALMADTALSGTTYNEENCSLCHAAHAADAKGVIMPGAPLAGALSRPTYWGGSVDTLLGAVNDCLYYHMLANDPWTGDEDDAQAVYAYLEDLDKEATDAEKAAQPFTIGPVAVPDSGDKAHGEKLYGESCFTCHGAAHTAAGRRVKIAPEMPEETLSVHPSPTYSDSDRRLIFVEKTRHGGFLGYGGQMPPFSEERLSDQDVADILAFLGVPL